MAYSFSPISPEQNAPEQFSLAHRFLFIENTIFSFVILTSIAACYRYDVT
jgi:hypothetical protein